MVSLNPQMLSQLLLRPLSSPCPVWGGVKDIGFVVKECWYVVPKIE